MSPKRGVKCFVPLCENVVGCGKIFLHVPNNPETLHSWCDAVGARPGTKKCCEDHFELAEDAENWQYFKLCGNGLKIKKGVVPHKYLTSKRPDSGSQFSDDDKKIKLEFMSSLLSERTSQTRVNRLEDLEVSGSTAFNELKKLANNNSRTKHNAPGSKYRKTGPEIPSEVSRLEVTPDIYICSCVHDHTDDAVSDQLDHRNSCSTQTPEPEYVHFLLGPTTDVPDSDDRSRVPATTSSRPRKKPSKVESEEEYLSSESDLSIFDGDYSEEDPDYDPDSDGRDDDRYHEEEPPLSELKEDELIRTVLERKACDGVRKSDRRSGKRKCAQKLNRKTVKAPSKSKPAKRQTNNAKKIDKQRSKTKLKT